MSAYLLLRRALAVGASVTLACLAGGAVGFPVAAAGSDRPTVHTVVLPVPVGSDPSEPDLAVDPQNPRRLYAVAQTVKPEFFPLTQELLWRTADGGRTWTRSPLLGGDRNTPAGVSGDPVVAAGPHGLVLYGTLTFDFRPAAGVAVEHVGTRVATDRGATFSAFGSAMSTVVPLCFFSPPCQQPPPPTVQFLDKPWLAIDNGHSRYRGSAYLVWNRLRFSDGQLQLLVATSRDGGRSFGEPTVIETANDADMAGLESLAQLVVRPNGTVDLVWNSLRGGRPVILHAVTRNGGRSFSAPEVVVRLRPKASRLGIVTSLAVSPSGRLGLCWSQALSADRYDARVACRISAPGGAWGPASALLPGGSEREFLPAAAFRGERLWVTAYVAGAHLTRFVAVPQAGAAFAPPIVVNEWAVPRSRICGPHPPDCRKGQTFIGDYTGLVATERGVAAAYVEPSAHAPRLNRVLFSTISP